MLPASVQGSQSVIPYTLDMKNLQWLKQRQSWGEFNKSNLEAVKKNSRKIRVGIDL